jgi:hypothetical protein
MLLTNQYSKQDAKLRARIQSRVSELPNEAERRDAHLIAEYLRCAFPEYARTPVAALRRLVSSGTAAITMFANLSISCCCRGVGYTYGANA